MTICVGVFMVSMDLFIVNLAFPDIRRDFPGTSLSGLSWILNAYAIGFGALLVPAGRTADQYGRKRVFLLGMCLFTSGLAACALAPSVPALIVARALQSVGAALLFPASLGLLLPEWPARQFAIPVAIWAAVGGVAAAAAPPLGGLLVQAGWRWVFIVNVPIGVVTVLIGLRVLAERREVMTASRPDMVAAGLFVVAIAALILAVVQGRAWGWDSAGVLGLFALAAGLSVLVAARCLRHPVPLIDPQIVRTRAVALANLSAVLFYCAFATLLLGMILFETTVWHESALIAGLQFAPGPLTSACVAVPAGLAGQRIGQRFVGAAGCGLVALSIVWFTTQMTAEPHYAAELLPAMLVGGIGVGLVLPALSAAATGPLPPNRLATGAALLGMSRQIGSALGVAILIAILGRTTPSSAVLDFREAWDFLIACALAAAATLLALGPLDARETLEGVSRVGRG